MSEETPRDIYQPAMFITVKYGDDLEQILNPNCRNNVLLQHIKKKCMCDHEDRVELADENGRVKHLQKHLWEYGTDYFRDRETVILLKANTKQSEEEKLTYTPQLLSLQSNKEFLGKLNSRSRPSAMRRQRSHINAGNISRDADTGSDNGGGSPSPDRKRSVNRKISVTGRKSVTRKTSRISTVSPPKGLK